MKRNVLFILDVHTNQPIDYNRVRTFVKRYTVMKTTIKKREKKPLLVDNHGKERVFKKYSKRVWKTISSKFSYSTS